MSLAVVGTYRGRRAWRSRTALAAATLLPLSLVGFSVAPAVAYGELTSRLAKASERSARALELRVFLARFGKDGPPSALYREAQAVLAARLPEAFTATDFYRAAVEAALRLGVALDAIVPAAEVDLGAPVGERTVHERTATLHGRCRPELLPRFLTALHRDGHPVRVRACTLTALDGEKRLFDFQLELGALFLATPAAQRDELPEEP